jgi:hypothetical protein
MSPHYSPNQQTPIRKTKPIKPVWKQTIPRLTSNLSPPPSYCPPRPSSPTSSNQATYARPHRWWAQIWDPLALLYPFCISSVRLVARNPVDSMLQQHIPVRRSPCPFLNRRQKKMWRFCFLAPVESYNPYLLCLGQSIENPLRKLHLLHINPILFSDLTLVLDPFASTIRCVLQIFANP